MWDTCTSHFEPKKIDRVSRRGQKQPKLAYICTFKNTQFWLFLAPPANPVKFLGFKMAGRGVLHIVLHVLCPIRPSGNHFRPSKVSFSAVFAVLCDLFYKAKTRVFKKGHFPQQIWLKICVWNPKHLLDLDPRAGKWEFFGPKISLRVGV